MKAVLRFQLPEEEHEFQDALNGGVHRRAFDEAVEFIRRKLKYSELPEAEQKIWHEVRTHLIELRAEQLNNIE